MRRFSIPALALVLTPACNEDAGHGADDGAFDEFRVGNGDPDYDDEYTYVARLFHYVNEDTASTSCTGILITPGLVLTANHCVRDDGCSAVGVEDLTDDDWTIDLGSGTFANDLSVNREHSFVVHHRGVDFTQPVIERIGGHVDMCTKDDPSRDLAIMRLDRRVPLSEVTPMHVPVLPEYPSCDDWFDDFEATMVGFGLCGTIDTECEDEDDVHGRPRTSTTKEDWEREDDRPDDPFAVLGIPVTVDLPGAVYSRYWPWYEFNVGTYDGTLPGDSGGPLVAVASLPWLLPGVVDGIVGNPGGRLLCGVGSRYYPVTQYDMFPMPAPADEKLGADYAAVDGDSDNDNDDWLFEHAVAADNTFIGECFAGDPSLASTVELRDQDRDDDLIPDLCDPCPDFYDHDYDAGLALTPDFDSDGVPDRCDNCATIANAAFVTGSPGEFRVMQGDFDDDGYGDACDTCPDSHLVPLTSNDPEALPSKIYSDYTCCTVDADCAPDPGCPGFGDGQTLPNTNICIAGDSRGLIIDGLEQNNNSFELCTAHCATPVDTDCDQHGDLCDDCPTNSDPAQTDADADGIGDICDNCPGGKTTHAEDLNPECYWFVEGDMTCETLDPDSVCLPPHPDHGPDAGVSRCTLHHDADGDGRGDACDSCELQPNPKQDNCNVVTEIDDGLAYPYIGDTCDRNPCTTFTATQQVLTPSLADELGWVAKVEYSPRLLPPWQPADPHYGPAFGFDCLTEGVHCDDPRATTGLRFCACDELDASGKPDPLECIADGCAIDSFYYTWGSNWWTPSIWPELADVNGLYMSGAEIADQPMINPVPGDPLGAGSLLPDGSSPTSKSYWYVSEDIAAHGSGETRLTGILWSHVSWVTDLEPNEQDAADAYEPYSNYYRGGIWGPPPEDWSADLDIPATWHDYIYKGCPLEFFALAPEDEPTLVIDAAVPQEGELRVAYRSEGGGLELTQQIANEAREALKQTDVVWVAGSEMLDDPSGLPALVALSQDGLSVSSVLGTIGGRMVQLSEADSPTPQIVGRESFAAALSATQSSLYVIGGLDAATRLELGDVLRYDITARSWTQLLLTGERPGVVLAATYRIDDNALFAVDIKNGKARLLHIDLSTRHSTILGQWTRDGAWNHTWLRNSTDGRLVLVAAADAGGYAGMAFDPTVDLRRSSDPSFLTFSGSQRLVGAPTLTEHGLTLRVHHSDRGVVNELRTSDALLGARGSHSNSFVVVL